MQLLTYWVLPEVKWLGLALKYNFKKIRLKIEKFPKGVYMFETLWGGSNSGQGMFFAI